MFFANSLTPVNIHFFSGFKGDENVKLGISSIFGSAKMTQVGYSNPSNYKHVI